MKMTMKNINENLERSYQLFLNRQQPLDFFNDLAGYLDYVFSVSLLKEVFTKQLEGRNAKYEQKWKLEKQAMAEIRAAKQKIEKVFKKRKIDTNTLKRFRTSPLFTNSDPGIMQEWEDYESGRIQTGDGGNFRCNRRSDDFNELVDDMAANLYTRGYKDDVKEFLVSDDEYRTYYRRINGSGVISRTSNPNGNFICSQALPARWEVENLIQTERYAKPWGAFEKLYQFWIAHKNISRGVDAEGTLEEVARALEETKKTDDGKYIIGPDSYDILYMQLDFRNLLGERANWFMYSISTWRPNHLVVDQIKAAAETMHNLLLRTAEENKGSTDTEVNGKMETEAGKQVQEIVCVKPKKERAKFKVIINGTFELMVRGSIHNNSYWETLLSLAESGYVQFDKGFFDYFNSNLRNPIYTKTGLLKTQILKKEGDGIVKNITIRALARNPNKVAEDKLLKMA